MALISARCKSRARPRAAPKKHCRRLCPLDAQDPLRTHQERANILEIRKPSERSCFATTRPSLMTYSARQGPCHSSWPAARVGLNPCVSSRRTFRQRARHPSLARCASIRLLDVFPTIPTRYESPPTTSCQCCRTIDPPAAPCEAGLRPLGPPSPHLGTWAQTKQACGRSRYAEWPQLGRVVRLCRPPLSRARPKERINQAHIGANKETGANKPILPNW
jgi:hypothetical protein